jgi:phage/plasmid-like protein (TIGR03299 family)
MPHEISITNGRAEMMYTGSTPWHGLGTALDNPVDMPTGIRAAGLDFTVAKQPLYRYHNGEYQQVKDRYMVVREDTNAEFGVVSGQYEILQNIDAFDGLEEILGRGHSIYETAGALRGGKVVWIMAKLPETVEAVLNDPIEKYILLSTSHDASQSLEISTTPIRVVCANTLRFALRNAQYRVRVRHTASIKDRAVEVRRALNLSEAYFALMMEGIERLAQIPMRDSHVVEYAKAVLNVNPEKDGNRLTTEAIDRFVELYYAGRGQDIPGVRGTAYAGFNAATEYLDNFARVKTDDYIWTQNSVEAQDHRLYRSWFGKGQQFRDRAFKLAQSYGTDGLKAFEGVYIPRNTRRAGLANDVGTPTLEI